MLVLAVTDELKQLLKSRSLKCSGKKIELMARLIVDDKEKELQQLLQLSSSSSSSSLSNQQQKQNDNATVNNVLVFYQITDTELAETRFMEPLRHEFPELTFIVIDHNIPDWKQMLTMAICKYNVIANSTFSWWGAYFNSNEDKIVCYPDPWFGPSANHNVDDLFPDTWTRITA